MTRIPFILLSTSDGSPLTGAAPTVTISKDGAAFAAATNAPHEIGNGYYYIDLTSAETTVTNNVIVRATATGAQPTAIVWEPEQVIPTASDNATAVWGAQTKEVTIATAQAETFATASAVANIATTASGIKAKTDNLPQNPAAAGDVTSAQTAIIGAMPDISNLATANNVTTAQAAIIAAMPDVTGLSTFNASTDTVTIDATQAAGMATATGFATPSDIPTDYAKPSDITAAQTALTSLLNSVLSGLYHWQVNDTMLTVYNNAGTAIGAYTLTKDSDGNIIAVTPVVTPNEG